MTTPPADPTAPDDALDLELALADLPLEGEPEEEKLPVGGRVYSPTDALYSGSEVSSLDSLRKPGSAARFVYLGLTAVPIIVIGALLMIRSGFADPSRSSKTPWDLAIVVVGFLVTITMAAVVLKDMPRLYERARGIGIEHTSAALEFISLLFTIPIAITMSLLAIAGWAGIFTLLGLEGRNFPTILAGGAMVVACLPLAIFAARRAHTIRLVEQRFPDLLRDLNESHSAGLTMAQSVRVAAKGDYGRLNPEIRRMANQVSWGTSFPEALRMFSERIDTPLIHRAVSLINKATEAGGNVKDVLAAAARDARELKTLEQERRGGMVLYVIVIYVAFGVFLAVVAALQGLLIPAVLSSTSAAAGAGSGLSAIGINQALTVQDYHFIYYGVGLVQAAGSGIVAGVMSEGTVRAGLKHIVVLVGVTVVILGIML